MFLDSVCGIMKGGLRQEANAVQEPPGLVFNVGSGEVVFKTGPVCVGLSKEVKHRAVGLEEADRTHRAVWSDSNP